MKPASDAPLTIPPALAAELQAAADEEHRPVADVLRDALEGYRESRRWRRHADVEHARAHELGLADDDASLTPEYRQTLRDKIAQGLQSLRDGKGTDGEAFFAQMEAEFAVLEQQGSK